RQQLRPLLVLSAQSQPSRRFLRALERGAPALARRFVVAAGDSISFNLVYRDRNVTWPIQDLPFNLVFFCHRNPVDPAADWKPADQAAAGDDLSSPPGTATDDLLLYRDIVEAVIQSSYQGDALPQDGEALGRWLGRIRWLKGRIGFRRDAEFDRDARPLFF